jgi:hypothetical protein
VLRAEREKLYLRGRVFACHQRSGLAYASQCESPRQRALKKSRIRPRSMASILDPVRMRRLCLLRRAVDEKFRCRATGIADVAEAWR